MASNRNNATKPAEYFTDKKDLTKETEWMRVKKRKKKRKMDTSLTPCILFQIPKERQLISKY